MPVATAATSATHVATLATPAATPVATYVQPNPPASPQQDGGGQFCCTQCGVQYQARKQSHALIPAQHVWIMGEHLPAEGAASQTSFAERAPLYEQECIMMLGVWPDTAEETVIKQMQEIHAGVPAKFRDLNPDEVTRQLIKMVRCHQVPGIFKPMSMTPLAKKVIDYRNSTRGPGKPMFRYDHIPESFMGAVVPWDPPNTSVMNATEIGDMIQLCGIMQHQMLQNLNAKSKL